ncbi:flavohemoprotein [Actinobacteria bacterium YIM 96077]|uniref:nitric oxide dioxygenase n=1 Tax=Phytoactinopolyspora halophila TaxID=1981511 RepID=A0A329R0B9_9ACTN|nr:globin domain-containing protein [Phytoactinopolyspora halophila]AYY11448.1 flavohemoprotein [Actinobacteria bacterium YIM 96077]RAW18070.1 flavohemoprotein [Phytoactinopolyspora halophila]
MTMWTHSRAAGKRGSTVRRAGDAVEEEPHADAQEAAFGTPVAGDAQVNGYAHNGNSAVAGNGAGPAPAIVGQNGVERVVRDEITTASTNVEQARADSAADSADTSESVASPEAGELTLRPEPEASAAGPASAPLHAVPSNALGFDTAALRETITLTEDRLEQLAQRFYAILFARNPELRDLFPVGMEAQRSRIVAALVHIVGTADNRDEVVEYLEALGRDHRKFGVITEHYAPLGSALVRAFREELGEQWTTRHESAWVHAYDTIATIMTESAERDAVMWPAWWDAEVVFHRRLLDDLAIIQARPHTDFPYRPGQYCYVMSPRRPNMWRALSMASAPRDDGLVEFHVRAVGAGWVSSALVWRTEAGDILRLGAPIGYDLANPRSERDLLCIAGGVGIAPILAGLQELEQRLDGRRVHVFYAGRDRDSLYALPHLESIGVRYRRLTVVPVVSPEGPEDRSPDLMGNIVSAYGDWREHDVYLAGPTTMVQAALDRLREQQVPEEQIVCDDYGIW